ncbi:Membrane-bound lytic murein transglycosylase A precursor [Tsuneonella dongtanensis]|uniref:peptidoglycan lytic exotransglycosylase n=1 Tax=Tsuneonella dongtanensis TaxID=692370 RepID=A0A1B2AC87_9SPHN|nr:murein transglycosylase A [Tsuneonella dongtanensis]ANY19665.1 Membrane-bound lytic murein transglycosylase A precursor [Tsuneonella dongtanensis]
MRSRVAITIALATVLLGGCRLVPETATPITPTPPAPVFANAAAAGLVAGPAISSLGIRGADAAGALASFRESCPKLLSRDDASGLTSGSQWEPACTAARAWGQGDALAFFDRYFETARVGDGSAFATGYYEPEIAGSRTRRPGYDVPVYALPPELERGWWDETPESERTGRQQLGRRDASGRFVPYYERAEIVAGALANRGLEIAWAADPVEFFFLQIQGSGRLKDPEGRVIRIGYAGQNGREYTGIGRVMRERGLIGGDTGYATSMQGLMSYIRDHPDEGRAIMNENKSWIFFKELTGDGPLGALNVPVRRESSVAADPAFVPLGAPVWLDMDRPEADGMWIAQDTGGAIKGANRFDTFWGAGDDARLIAGGMSARGKALLFLPKGTVARFGSPTTAGK